jgi:hypothetical protein
MDMRESAWQSGSHGLPPEDSHLNLGGLQMDLNQDIGSFCAGDLREFDTRGSTGLCTERQMLKASTNV